MVLYIYSCFVLFYSKEKGKQSKKWIIVKLNINITFYIFLNIMIVITPNFFCNIYSKYTKNNSCNYTTDVL